jgi:hypothetical protein
MELRRKKGAHGGNMVSPMLEIVPKLTELVKQKKGA